MSPLEANLIINAVTIPTSGDLFGESPHMSNVYEIMRIIKYLRDSRFVSCYNFCNVV